MICVAIALLIALARPTNALEVGQTAPNWMLYNTKGDAVLLYEQLPLYSKTALFFWASWCQRCSELLPTLDKLANSNEQHTQVLTLNLWDEQDPSEHLGSLGVNLPILTKAGAVAQRYGVAGTPALVVIDRDRKVIAIEQAGEVTPEALASLLQQ